MKRKNLRKHFEMARFASPQASTQAQDFSSLLSYKIIISVCSVCFHFECRTTPKTQYTGCSVHENNNGQAAFENPMYNTNAKAVEGKAVRFDPNLNTVCTMV